ncbi:MAG: hypothetical protein ACR2NJ_00680 [Acidimicrobiales bacterium]
MPNAAQEPGTAVVGAVAGPAAALPWAALDVWALTDRAVPDWDVTVTSAPGCRLLADVKPPEYLVEGARAIVADWPSGRASVTSVLESVATFPVSRVRVTHWPPCWTSSVAWSDRSSRPPRWPFPAALFEAFEDAGGGFCAGAPAVGVGVADVPDVAARAAAVPPPAKTRAPPAIAAALARELPKILIGCLLGGRWESLVEATVAYVHEEDMGRIRGECDAS